MADDSLRRLIEQWRNGAARVAQADPKSQWAACRVQCAGELEAALAALPSPQLFPNVDHIMHAAQHPDCNNTEPHLIDACGAFNPKFIGAASGDSQGPQDHESATYEAIGRYVVQNARWLRHEHEHYAAAPVAFGANLESAGMRFDALSKAAKAGDSQGPPLPQNAACWIVPSVPLAEAARELADAAFDYHVHSELHQSVKGIEKTARLLGARQAVLAALNVDGPPVTPYCTHPLLDPEGQGPPLPLPLTGQEKDDRLLGTAAGESRERSPMPRRDIALLRKTVSMLCNFAWTGQTRPGEHLWSIPVDKERDFDCILTDAIDELERLRRDVATDTPSLPKLNDHCAEKSSTGAAEAPPLLSREEV